MPDAACMCAQRRVGLAGRLAACSSVACVSLMTDHTFCLLVSWYLLMHHCSQKCIMCMTKRLVLCSQWAATALSSLLQALQALLCSVSLQATSS